MNAELPNRALAYLLLLSATLALPGCWTPPRSDVQPPGEPRLIANHIRVQSDADSAVVQAVDAQARTLTLVCARRRSPGVYSVSPSVVAALGQLNPGERIRAIPLDELSIYVLRANEPASIAGERVQPQARVLSADPTYRLLTIQYPDGEKETFKVGLDVKLGRIQAGDAVVISPIKLTSFRRQK
jgi:hypothetical protein